MAKKFDVEAIKAELDGYDADYDITATGVLKRLCVVIDGVSVFFSTTFAFVLRGAEGLVTWDTLPKYLVDNKVKYENVEKTDGFYKVLAFDMADFDYEGCQDAVDCACQPYTTSASIVELSETGETQIADILGFLIYTYAIDK